VPAEIPDAVAGQQTKADIAAFVIETCEAIDDLDHLVGLQKHRAVVDRVSHRDGQLHLPVFGAGRDDFVEYLRQLRQRQRVDLGVDARLDPDIAYVFDGADRLIVAAGDPS
jgi:hypothetical protein